MAAELIWTEQALDDVDAIAEFIARLIYEIGSEHVAILAVIHGRRLLESIAERFQR